jgi:peptide/nickel transport system permease protein
LIRGCDVSDPTNFGGPEGDVNRDLIASGSTFGGESLPIDPAPEAPAANDAVASPTSAGLRSEGRRIGVGGWIAAGFLIAEAIIVLFAPVIPFFKNPDQRFYSNGLLGSGPSSAHWLGIDSVGKDILRQTIWGARASLPIGIGAIVIGMLIGGPLGLIAGYARGWSDTIIGYIFDITLSVPALILALAFTQFLGNDVKWVTVALGIVSIPLLGRIVRASTLTWAGREFVIAARAQGATHRRILLREILPNVWPAMFAVALLGIGVAIVAEGSLSVLGAGVNPSTATWGNAMYLGYTNITTVPSGVLSPATAILLTTLALSYLGDAIEKKYATRESTL